MLLATRHKRTNPALTPAGEGWYSIYRPRRDGRLSWPRCPITRGRGIEPKTAGSEVRRPNHCATKTPNILYSSLLHYVAQLGSTNVLGLLIVFVNIAKARTPSWRLLSIWTVLLVSCVAERRQNGAKVSVRAAGLLVSTSVDAAGQRGWRRRYVQWRYDADVSHRQTVVANSTLPQSSSRRTSSTTVAHLVVLVSGLRPMTHHPSSPSKLLVPKSRTETWKQ